MSCICRCHTYGTGTHATCDLDTGSSGTALKSCSPCDSTPPELVGASKLFCCLPHSQRAPRASVGLICLGHATGLAEDLRDVLELWALLGYFALPGSAPEPDGSQRPKKPADAPVPVRLDVVAMRDKRTDDDERRVNAYENGPKFESNGAEHLPSISLLALWADYVCIRRGITRTRRPKPAEAIGPLCRWWARSIPCPHASCRKVRPMPTTETVAEQVGFLTTHLDWLCADPRVAGFHAAVRSLKRHLGYAHGDRSPKPYDCYMLVPADNGEHGAQRECGGLVWPTRDGSGAKCNTCGRMWMGLEMVRLTAVAMAKAAQIAQSA